MKPRLFTSIPPRVRGVDFEPSNPESAQVRTIESWQSAGFEPISIHLNDEFHRNPQLPDVLRHYGVEPVAITPEMRVRTSIPLCPIRDFLEAIRTHQGDAPIAIINADIRLAPSSEQALGARVAAMDETEFLIGQRSDITSYPDGSRSSVPHGFGIDFFAFRGSWIQRVRRALSPTLGMGLPWWDHYLPLSLLAYGANVRLLDPRWFEHDVHSFRWNWGQYCRIGRAAKITFQRAMISLESSSHAQYWLNALDHETYHPAIPPSVAPLVQRIAFHDWAPTVIAKSSLGRLAAANMRIILQSATQGPVPISTVHQPAEDANRSETSGHGNSVVGRRSLSARGLKRLGDFRESFSTALTPIGRRPKSVYFFTFHKCASTLFGSLILKRAVGLKSVNFAYEIYNRNGARDKPLSFEDRGCIYGPIRLTRKVEGDLMEEVLLRPVTEPEFLRSKRAVFLVRDPRAILTSEYYSFGLSHSLSKNQRIRQSQEIKRQEIQSQTLDEYVLGGVERLIESFDRLDFVQAHCQERIVLRYEDLVDDFDAFVEKLCTFIPLRQGTIDRMYRESRPNQAEDIHSHKRSGLPSGFRKKLLPETIDILNRRMAPILLRYGYEF